MRRQNIMLTAAPTRRLLQPTHRRIRILPRRRRVARRRLGRFAGVVLPAVRDEQPPRVHAHHAELEAQVERRPRDRGRGAVPRVGVGYVLGQGVPPLLKVFFGFAEAGKGVEGGLLVVCFEAGAGMG